MLGATEGLIVGGFLDSQADALTATDSAPRVVMPALDRLVPDYHLRVPEVRSCGQMCLDGPEPAA